MEKKSGINRFNLFKLYFKKFKNETNFLEFGEFYFEGKDLRQDQAIYYPGSISVRLRSALGLGNKALPSWINKFRKYGLPPAYPNLDLNYGTSKIGKINFSLNDFYKSFNFSYWC